MKKEEKQDYSYLNFMLNDYCLWMENTSFLNNLLYFYIFTNKLKKYLESHFSYQKIEKLKEKAEKASRYLTLTETLDLVTEYIEERLPQYKDTFLRSLNDGTIDINASLDDEKAINLYNMSGQDEKNHIYVNTALRHNTKDPTTLVHEFLHSLNNEGGSTISRRYMTEAISIYFELDMYNFLKRKGFSEEELMCITMHRFSDFYGCINDFVAAIPILNCFLKTGTITNDSYEFLEKFNIHPRPKLKEDFYKQVEKIDERLKEETKKAKESGTEIDLAAKYSPLVPFSYIIGTLVAYYAIDKDDENMHQRMINLNKIVNKKEFAELMSFIGIDISTHNTLIGALKPALDKKIIEIKDYDKTIENKGKEK